MPSKLPTREYENELFALGYDYILGVDEVGRGCIAGNVTIGMVLVTPEMPPWPSNLKDSKLVPEKKRQALSDEAWEWIMFGAIGNASADEIESLGINVAQRLAGERAYEKILDMLEQANIKLSVEKGIVLLDGSVDWLSKGMPAGLKVITKVKADQDCVGVSAASIIAKVARDNVMIELSKEHPEYAWNENKGYGSAGHYAAIKEHGMIQGIHRESWIKL